MLVDKDAKRASSNASLRILARRLFELGEDKRRQVLSSLPTQDRVVLMEMIKDLEDDKPLLKG